MTAPEDQNGLREALARAEAPVVHEFQIRESDPWYGEYVTAEGETWFVHAHEFKAYRAWAEARARAAEAEITRLKEGMKARDAALRPFAAGGSWGGWLSWLINGAPDREQGKAAAKQIVHWRAAVDVILSPKEQPQ